MTTSVVFGRDVDTKCMKCSRNSLFKSLVVGAVGGGLYDFGGRQAEAALAGIGQGSFG
ncbi:hypothetical protein [Streptomyces sp. NPDC003006]